MPGLWKSIIKMSPIIPKAFLRFSFDKLLNRFYHAPDMRAEVIEAAPEKRVVAYYDGPSTRYDLKILRNIASMHCNGRGLRTDEIDSIDLRIAESLASVPVNEGPVEAIAYHMASIIIKPDSIIAELYGHPKYKQAELIYRRPQATDMQNPKYPGAGAVMTITMELSSQVIHYGIPGQSQKA